MARPRTSAYEIGERYEQSLSDRERRLGAHFTPADVAEALVARAWEAHDHDVAAGPVFCDPSCGGGAFLIAAANRLHREGHSPRRIVERLVVGIDLDPGAVEASTQALIHWADEALAAAGAPGAAVADAAVADAGVAVAGVAVADPRATVTPRVFLADGLIDPLDEVGPIDIVVGNPPFQNQLGADTARDAAQRAAVVERFGLAAKGYVDVASLFILRALRLVRPGGTVCLIQPRSLLAARDSAAVRASVLEGNRLDAVWLPGSKIFAAAVDVCAPIITAGVGDAAWSTRVIGGRLADIELGRVSREQLAAAPAWSPLWAVATGVPTVEGPRGEPAASPSSALTIGDLATATAGFRDQFYGVVAHLVAEQPRRGARVVSTGMIDPLALSWSTRSSKIGGAAWVAPWVDLDAVAASDPDLDAWIARQLTPKVLVATQTKVLEVVEDQRGDLVPLTPVISVVPRGEVSVAHLAAALLVPAATAWAAARFGGGGMSHTALKLAAKQVLEIPVPCDADAWGVAAERVQRGAPDTPEGWLDLAATLNASWGIDDAELAAWWVARLPQMSSRR
ncbi:MAG: SAM-dependent DNA methyltransferase [Actinobacteria bacterium]|nr:SAM-dependent DNA methyltransferase [Actinomycetota bacterium]